MSTFTVFAGLIISHLVVAYVAFQLGGLAAYQFMLKELDKE
jgi:hypothetical protein